MFRKQRFTGVIGVSADPTPRFFPLPLPLENQRFHSLGCSSDLYVRARHAVSTFIVPSVLCGVCVWRATRSGGKERGRERKEHRGSLVSLYFIEWNETPAGGLIKGYGTWWESLKIRKKKKETRVYFVIYFVWKYICELISKTGWIFFFLVFFRAEIGRGKISLTKRICIWLEGR